ncbi:MAG: CvpA family protein [Lachnospiraceae bacterium]|nr:CvpA family protein [Lachnospiraceae bacterium]
MTEQLRLVILCILAVLLLFICVKRGYSNGLAVEIKKLAGIVVALICIILIIALRGAFSDNEYGTAFVIIGAVVILSMGWKFVKMVLGLLSGLKDLPVIGWLDSLLGALIGAAECAAIIWIAMRIYRTVMGS